MREEPLPTSKFCNIALNQKGSTILSALIMGVVVIIMILSSATYINSRAKAVAASANKMDNRIALDGMLAYTLNGIKQSWCFGDTWTHQTTCLLTDPRNTARLLLSDESLQYIGASTAIRPPNLADTRLNSITQKVQLTGINENHPLYNIARPLDGKYSDVTFTIRRDDSAVATTKGREVRLKVFVFLKARSGAANDDLELESQVVVYPRELSYFSLIMPGNLFLGGTAAAKGDIGLAASNVTSNTAGLRFESPVFVNKNLHLPPSANSTPMNNVIFLDKVVLGGGMIFQNGTVYTPTNSGGEKYMYNHEMKSFKGLLGGYELDEEKDSGLEYLFKTQSSSYTISESDFEKCLKRIQASYDLKVTKYSQLFMRYNGPTGNSFNLSASIGNVDNFIEQNVGSANAYKIVSSVSDPTFSAGTVDSVSGGAIFKVKVVYSGLKPLPSLPRGVYTSEFYISRQGTVTLTPQGSAASPSITVKTRPFNYGGNDQFNEVYLDITYGNAGALDLAPYPSGGLGVSDSIKFFIEAHDYAYNEGKNLRSPADTTVTEPKLGIFKSNGMTFYKTASGVMQIAYTDNAWSTNEMLNADISGDLRIWEQAPELIDWTALDKACMSTPETGSSAFYASFPSANWGTSFAKQSEHAWRFSTDFPNGYLDGPLYFNDSSNKFDASHNPTFMIRSVAKECIIESTANFVAGFYVCESMIIRPRTDSLRIIGTFITGNLTIDPSAYAAGIRWSSIYHPQALYELRAAKILGKYKDGTNVPDCNATSLPPLWSPNLGIASALAHYICNPVSLRTADPFKWTMVDPDCGIDDAGDKTKVACKSQPRRFLIKEISRTKGL